MLFIMVLLGLTSMDVPGWRGADFQVLIIVFILIGSLACYYVLSSVTTSCMCDHFCYVAKGFEAVFSDQFVDVG